LVLGVMSSEEPKSDELVIPCRTCGRPAEFELRLPILDGGGDYFYYFTCPAGHMHAQRRDEHGNVKQT
jgi:hypothetical protein